MTCEITVPTVSSNVGGTSDTPLAVRRGALKGKKFSFLIRSSIRFSATTLDELCSCTMSGVSAEKRVLNTPELLSIIFQFSSHHFSNALVCKTWSNEALSFIWYSIDGLLFLLRLLAPLVGDDRGRLVFSRQLTSQDWDRFRNYSWRVRRLWDVESWRDCSISLLSDIASTRPPGYLLPNLRILNYDFGPSVFLPVFLHPNLQEISLRYDLDLDPDPGNTNEHSLQSTVLRGLPRALSLLPSHAPHLECLNLSGDLDLEVFKDHLCAILSPSALPKLKSLSLPFLHPTLIQTISALSRLEHLAINAYSRHPGSQSTAHDFVVPFGGFSSLETLSTKSAPALAVLAFVEITLPCLLHLELGGGRYTHDHRDQLFSSLGANCRALECLKICYSVPPYLPIVYLPTPFSVFRHILACSNLQNLELVYHMSFDLDADNILSIVQALPRLTSFNINNSIQPGPSPDLSLLPIIAPHCRNLEYLGLCVDARLSIHGSTSQAATFPRLKNWHVGNSPATGPANIAIYLSKILPNDCVVEYNSHHTRAWQCWYRVVDLLKRLRRSEVASALRPPSPS